MTTQQQGSRRKKLPPTGNMGDVMVVGGGVSGIQASLDLANNGFRVFLVDEAPNIGGKMAQLDKTFPTNDCSMCILSPKFIECDRHPNIEILAYTEVEKVTGEAGDFQVTLRRKPRFIDEELCIGCRECHHYCPVKIADEFNQNLKTKKSLFIPFAQSVPNVSTIDETTCLFFQGKCKSCVPICKNNAIDLYMKEEKVEAHVGAIILAPGYQVFDPALRADYGYGKMQNVITSLEYERIICAAGPFEGQLLRPSDKKHAKKIAWIQCVGSRQVTPGGNSYCSAVCCMYTTKQVILAKEHDSSIETTVFHNDIRAYGKDFEQYYNRAERMPGVRYIRSYVTVGREIPESKNVTIKYSVEGEGVKEEEFDLVVLSVGLEASTSAEKLAEKLSIDLNDHGFCKTNELSPIE
ncbi:MAG: FAD-dependent oxidoreductase, partial [Dehalococcoidales bacterium]|nr:FAD-dependent oxidoreductase [Dehalococcoidales bacterium]